MSGSSKFYGCYNSKLRSGLLNNPPRNIGVPLYQTGWKWTKTPEFTERNKKISKKMLRKYEKSRILMAREHFSMGLLWGQLHRDFLRFAY
jgi:hypothetical protein